MSDNLTSYSFSSLLIVIGGELIAILISILIYIIY